MSTVEDYLVMKCPICAKDTKLDYISVDNMMRPTFRYRCPKGHKFSEFRKQPLTTPEFAWVVTLTKRRFGGSPDVA